MEKPRKKYTITFILVAVMMLFVSACSQTTTGTTTSSNTPQQVMQKSADAMQKLTSAHMELRSTNSIQTSGSTATPTADANKSGTDKSATPAASSANINIVLTGNGDQVFPDQQQLNVTVDALSQKTTIAQVMKGDKIYIQNPEKKWFVLNKSDYAGVVGDPLAGVTFDQQTLLGAIQNVRIEDHGTVALNGQDLRHLTAKLDKTALKQLMQQNPQLKSSLGEKNVESVLDSAKKFESSVDVWIDETKFYIHRTQLKIDLTADTSAVGNGAPAQITTKLDTTVDLSKFNEPVTITEPTNAEPVKDPSMIFGSTKQNQ